MAGADQFLADRLAALREAGTFRALPGTRVGTDFWSNDYLGFSRLSTSAGVPFTTAPGSRLISGDSDRITGLEQEIAAFHGHRGALLFGSGYTANTGLLACIARRGDTFIYDECIHASTRDGIRLSGAAARRCKHNSLEQGRALLTKADRNGQVFFLTEARFSMDGDTAPLSDLAVLCQEYGVHLVVDEAHSVGIDGAAGAGLVSELQLQEQVFATVVTYGKAMGCSGAAILGSDTLRNYLINFCRPFIFTTGPRPEQLGQIANAYRLLSTEHAKARVNLELVIGRYRQLMAQIGSDLAFRTMPGPIQLIPLKGARRVMDIEQALFEDGYLVKGIRAPSVKEGEERLRICLHAFNSLEEVDGLCGQIVKHLVNTAK